VSTVRCKEKGLKKKKKKGVLELELGGHTKWRIHIELKAVERYHCPARPSEQMVSHTYRKEKEKKVGRGRGNGGEGESKVGEDPFLLGFLFCVCFPSVHLFTSPHVYYLLAVI
jgi:hypothetical protein